MSQAQCSLAKSYWTESVARRRIMAGSLACTFCGEDRFQNAAQGMCHTLKNHAEFQCPCNKRFLTEKDLREHEREKEAQAKEFRCPCCCRSFKTEESLYAHNRAKSHWGPGERENAQIRTGRFYCRDACMRSFKTKDALKHHIEYHQAKAGITHTCASCTKAFSTESRLGQHVKDTGHRCVPRSACKNYIDKRMKRIHVDPNDRKESVAVVKDTVDPILHYVYRQPGGKIYSPNYVKAGSHAYKAKIGKADEFDTNIKLKVPGKVTVHTRGQVPYKYKDKVDGQQPVYSPKNMNVRRDLVDHAEPIPTGHARVEVTKGVPDNLVYKGDLIPHEVLRDFHQKIKDAKGGLGMENAHLSRSAHGPALTLTSVQPSGHHINIDMTPTLSISGVATDNGWPRPASKKAFNSSAIEEALKAGVHLVPKGDTTWAISYSKIETALIKNIDVGNGCRRNVMKYAKNELNQCATSNGNGLPGFSSHIIKTALLWYCENHPEDGYWNQRNIDNCLIGFMGDLIPALRQGKLPNYFDTKENVLKGKDREVCNEFADHLHEERQKLIHM